MTMHENLSSLARRAEKCQSCDLYKYATQTVFGAGNETARVMFVGEQPGDYEDKSGKPFVGPAGKILDQALAAAGISKSDVYITNAVKHFKFEERGKKRLHKRPRTFEVEACSPWLGEEIQIVKPRVIVCLGATAAQSLIGKKFSVTRDRGQFLKSDFAPFIVATVHPSSILRTPTEEDRKAALDGLINDLKKVSELLKSQ